MVPTTDLELQKAIFAWKTPSTSFDWVAAVRGAPGDVVDEEEVSERLRHWLDIAWRQLVTTASRHLWQVHNDQLRPSQRPTGTVTETGDLHVVALRWLLQLRGTLAHLDGGAAGACGTDKLIQRTLCSGYSRDTGELPRLRIPSRGDDYVLFFDGGSRGNPGPGGSGAVVVKLGEGDSPSTVIWVAAMAAQAKTTTNNTAEYTGLITGLRAARTHNWHPLTVVGDSKLILTHMSTKQPPRKSALRKLYNTALQHRSGLYIRAWVHHYREFNKMADTAANIAMDTRRSSQRHSASDPTGTESVGQWCDNDVAHFLDNRARGIASGRPATPADTALQPQTPPV